jgi:hypothetical protein
MKTILITGDFIRDYNIVKQPREITGYRDDLPESVMGTRPGGAWFLEELIRLIYNKNKISIIIPAHPSDTSTPSFKVVKAFQVWAKFKEKENNDEYEVWRVDNFLGCENVKEKDSTKFTTPLKEFKIPVVLDVVLIDDLSLYFAEDEKAVKSLLPFLMKAANIILKTHSHRYNSRLWQLLEEENLLSKTTVVTTAESLRQGGAYISRGLSWDSTIENTARELNSGYYADIFAKCKRIIILYDKFGIASFTTESQEKHFPGTDLTSGKLAFERFVFDTQNYEASWIHSLQGNMYGALSILATAATLIDDEKAASSFIYKLALHSIQHFIKTGGGRNIILKVNEANDQIHKWFTNHSQVNLDRFCSAFPRYYHNFNFGLYSDEQSFHSNLLLDHAGNTPECLYAKACEIVMRGPEKALGPVPMANYGKYKTYDREEIERINSIKNLISIYRLHTWDKRPLSFAVFGAPGSGKSFAIKQVLQTIFKESNEHLVFNLTQMTSPRDLLDALHIIQDCTVKGDLPLVFWDEFDTEENKWLKDFLAPMQDGEFVDGSVIHPIGRAIFVFAGGTSESFADYEKKVSDQKNKKAPDFISRLRGYVNIKGPNRTPENSDEVYIIRRALLIRQQLKNHHQQIFNSVDVPAISPGVLNALLKVKKYEHGARSLESVISLGKTDFNRHFSPSSLPSRELLRIHTSEDFENLIKEAELEYVFIETLAQKAHELWMMDKKKAGYVHGKKRKDRGPGKKKHPQLIPYRKLNEEWKERNRATARLTKAKFAMLGYELIPKHVTSPNTFSIAKIVKENIDKLIQIEHDIWLKDRLLSGYEHGKTTNDDFLRHKDILSIKRIRKTKDIHLDEAIVMATEKILKDKKYKLIEKPKPETPPQEQPPQKVQLLLTAEISDEDCKKLSDAVSDADIAVNINLHPNN